MNIRELQLALEHSRERFFQAKRRLDIATEPELIDAAIYEQTAWEKRCEFYHRKLKETVASGQAVPNLHKMKKAYEKIGLSGVFGLIFTINPLVRRFESGERMPELYEEIMSLS